MTEIRTIDAHAGGQAVRLLVDGFPSPRGQTLFDKREWVRRHADRLRRSVVLEPRGHQDMRAAVLTESASPGSHAGVLFMDAHGYPAMCGPSLMAVSAIARARRLILLPEEDGEIVFETPVGVVRARAGGAGRAGVVFTNVPSFVLQAGAPVRLGNRTVPADIAFAGSFYAVVDSEAVGLGVKPAHIPELRRMGVAIARAAGAAAAIVHPLDRRLTGLDGTIFTAPASDAAAHLKSVTVSPDGVMDCSPGGTATAAIMSVLAAMGLVDDESSFVHEGILGSSFTGRIETRSQVGDYEAIVTAVEGSVWITGEHTFLFEDDDPFREGFLI